MIYETNAFLLKTEPFGEDDLICTFLAGEQGLVTAAAQGIRKMGAKQRSAISWFTPLTIRIGRQHKPINSGRLLTVETKGQLEFSLEQRLIGFAIIDLFRAFGPEPERKQKIFEIAKTAFANLADHPSRILTETIKEVLNCAGYGLRVMDYENSTHKFLHDHARLIAERNLFCPINSCQK